MTDSISTNNHDPIGADDSYAIGYEAGYDAGYAAGSKANAPEAYNAALAEGMRIAQAFQHQARRWQRLAGERAAEVTALQRKLRKADSTAARQQAPDVTSVAVQGDVSAKLAPAVRGLSTAVTGRRWMQ